MGVIYLVESKSSGKQYIGQTNLTIPERWESHLRDSIHKKTAFAAAIRKYGHCDFRILVLEYNILDQSELDAAEIYWISWYGTLSPAGYNLLSGGRGGVQHSETRKKMRAAQLGKTMPPETKAKISSALIAYNSLPEVIEAKRLAMTGNTYRRGSRQSIETCEKIGKSLRGRPVSAETRKKIRDAQIGKAVTEETRARLRAARAAFLKRQTEKT